MTYRYTNFGVETPLGNTLSVDAHCCFQDVCKRLEMVVRLRDLDTLSNDLDNRAYSRNGLVSLRVKNVRLISWH